MTTHPPHDLALAALESYQHQAVHARQYQPVFNEFVLRDETTRAPIENAPIHDELLDVIESNDRVVVIASPEMGKTQQLIGYILRQIGEDPTFRALIGSKKAENAAKPSRQAMRYVEHSPEYALCYPHVRPGSPWRAEGWKIDGAKFGDPKDMTLSVCGVGGSILGSRLNFALLDDIFDWENTRTEYRSDQIVEWIVQQLEGRMSRPPRKPGKIVLLMNAWREWDGGHKLVEQHGWTLFRLTARNAETGKSNWPAVWPQERIDSYPPAIAAQHLDAIATADGAKLFDDAWIRRCMESGRGLTLSRRLEPASMPPGAFCVTGVDLNHQKKKTSDSTVLFTVMVIPDEDGGLAWIRPVWIEEAIMNSPEIKAAIIDHYARYGSRFLVEDNAAQKYIVDDMNLGRPEITVEPFRTGANKWNPEYGIGGIATEMSMGRWVLPCTTDDQGRLVCEPGLERWLEHLRRFAPTDRAHTADDIMAGWFAWRGARDNFSHIIETVGPGAGVWTMGDTMSEAQRRARMKEIQGEALWESLEEDLGFERRYRDEEPVTVDGDDQWATMNRM